MCFSAQASFIASAALFGMSLLISKQVKRPEHKLFARIPLFFAIQQAAEGVVWLTVASPESLVHRAAVYAFLFFAYLLWPVYMPRAVMPLETVAWRRQALGYLSVVGMGISAFLLMHMIAYGVGAQVLDCHIVYQFQKNSFMDSLFGMWREVGTFLYACAVIAPFFISSVSYAWVMGTLIFVSMVASYAWYYLAFTSVWCFFAALLSAVIYFILRRS